jgi:hypothetical protein
MTVCCITVSVLVIYRSHAVSSVLICWTRLCTDITTGFRGMQYPEPRPLPARQRRFLYPVPVHLGDTAAHLGAHAPLHPIRPSRSRNDHVREYVRHSRRTSANPFHVHRHTAGPQSLYWLFTRGRCPCWTGSPASRRQAEAMGSPAGCRPLYRDDHRPRRRELEEETKEEPL